MSARNYELCMLVYLKKTYCDTTSHTCKLNIINTEKHKTVKWVTISMWEEYGLSKWLKSIPKIHDKTPAFIFKFLIWCKSFNQNSKFVFIFLNIHCSFHIDYVFSLFERGYIKSNHWSYKIEVFNLYSLLIEF